MLQCPQCTKPLRELARRCPTCQADLDLLVDYVRQLSGGLERAENCIRAGELGPAVWAYLEVLEVDPDNSAARKQVGDVVRAVRQFDLVTPGRRWSDNLPPPASQPASPAWLRWVLIATVVVLAFTAGFLTSQIPKEQGQELETAPPVLKSDNNQLGN